MDEPSGIFPLQPWEVLPPSKSQLHSQLSSLPNQCNRHRTTTAKHTDIFQQASPASALPRCLIPESDHVGHIEYKLRLPGAPTIDRLARLTSQLKWRLAEGGGEAIYEIGVCDNGWVLGIEKEEMESSLKTLNRMADGLGAKVEVVREIRVNPPWEGRTISTKGSSVFSLNNNPPSRHQTRKISVKGEGNRNAFGYKESDNNSRKGKKARRRMTRDANAQASLDPFEMPEDESGVGEAEEFLGVDVELADFGAEVEIASSLPTEPLQASERGDRQREDTPDFDDLPSLSHSPSPPWPQERQISYTATNAAVPYRYLENHRRHTPAPLPSDPVAAAELVERRLQRKESKKARRMAEKQKAQQLSLRHPNSPDDGLSYTVEERYLDGLVAIFDGIELTDVVKPDDAQFLMLSKEGQKRERKRQIKLKRKEKMFTRAIGHTAHAPLPAPPSTREIMHEMMMTMDHNDGDDGVTSSSGGSSTPAMVIKPIPKLAAIQGQKARASSDSNGRSTEGDVGNEADENVERWVVECLVYYPASSEGEDEGADMDDFPGEEDASDDVLFPSNGGGAGTSLANVNRRRSSRHGHRHRHIRRMTRSFIDFEGAHASL